MTRVALKGLASRPVRTILTTLAIVLGVGMVSAAFTLTDTMRHAANSLSSAAYDGTDAVVSAHTAFAVDSRATTRSSGRRSPRRCSARSAPCRRSAAAVGDISDQAKIIGRRRQARRRRPVLRRGLRLDRPGRREADGVPPPVRPLGDRAGRGRHRRRHGREAALRGRRPRAASTRAARPRTFRVVGVARFGNVKSLGHRDDRGVRPRDRAEAVPQAGPLRLDPRRRASRHVAARTSARRVAAAVGDSAQVQTAARA